MLKQTLTALAICVAAAGLLAHAVFLWTNWQSISDPTSSPCYNGGAPFGDCSVPLGLMGLLFPACSLGAVGFAFGPIAILAPPRARIGSLLENVSVSLLSLGVLLAVCVGLFSQGLLAGQLVVVAAILVSLPFSTALILAGVLNDGEECMLAILSGVSAAAVPYLGALTVFLTFD